MPSNNVSHSRSDRKVAKALERLERLLERQDQMLSTVSTLMERIMADKQQVADEIAKLKQAIVDDGKSDQDAVNTLVAAGKAMQAKIDELTTSGDTQHATDLQDILDQLNDAKSAIAPVSAGGSGETPVT